jgi:hypothetical protein
MRKAVVHAPVWWGAVDDERWHLLLRVRRDLIEAGDFARR